MLHLSNIRKLALGLAAWSLGLSSLPACGELVRFEIVSRTPYANSREFGDVGSYEQIVGRAHFLLDPSLRQNRAIVDLQLAPRNGAGLVAFDCDLFMLLPADPARANGCLLYDVNNRGNKLALRFFCQAPGDNLAGDPGDGFLLRKGYGIVWSGWDGELLGEGDRLQLRAPVARRTKGPITGRVRYEVTADEEGQTRLNINRGGHGAYRPAAEQLSSATLSWRVAPEDPRVLIPRRQFQIHVTDPGGSGPSQLPLVELELPAGFHGGYLYELIYTAQDPLVHGVCFASVRDLITALKHGEGQDNPLGEHPAERAIGFGVSQSGRFLREMLQSGFNEDERQRIVFDGLIPHVAGGGLGSFNHRFAQPTAYATQRKLHDWPTDRFPFTYQVQRDPVSGAVDGILKQAARRKVEPRIMHIQTSTEYWSRSGSLVHTDPRGRRDAPPPDNVRIYALGGMQHGPGSYPPSRGEGQNLANPGDYRPLLRALLTALEAWTRDDAEPPPSVYPTIEAGTLVDWSQQATRFPKIPGVRYPDRIQQPDWLDLGSRWTLRRVADLQPPRVAGHYRVLVPKCGSDGNELDCLLAPEVAAPLATFTGWNLLSHNLAGGNQLVGLNGSYIELPRTRADRRAAGDPRRSLQQRYGDLDGYVEAVRQACQDLVERRCLLEEDVEAIIERLRERAEPLFADG